MSWMREKWSRFFVVCCLIGIAIAFTQAPRHVVADNTQSQAMAKNVILFIADGAGFNHLLATSYYQHGAAGTQVYDEFPFQVAVSTYEYEYKDYTATNIPGWPWNPWYTESGKYELKGYDTNAFWSDFNYAIWLDPALHPNAGWYVNNNTDSASAATAMATGFKTKDGAIGYAFPLDENGNLIVDDEGKSYLEKKKNIVEIAEELGMATGVVSSVPFSHATPAGFVAHNESRGNTVAIANEMVYSSKIDVIMTPASPDYEDNGAYRAIPGDTRINEYLGPAIYADIADGIIENRNNIDANNDGVVDDRDRFVVIRDQAEFQAYAEGPTPTRVLGLPMVRRALQYYRTTDRKKDPFVDPFIPNIPTLAEMTKAALNVLKNNNKGFFLMVEGGAIDWAGHHKEKGRMIEETIDFNRAVEAAVAWVEANSNWGETMIIITADHETGFLWGPGSGKDPVTSQTVYNPIVNNGANVVPGMEFYSPIGWHTNSLVPLYAKGAAGRLFNGYAKNVDLVYGPYIDNTDIFKIIKYCIENYAAHEAQKAKGKPPVPPGQGKK